MQINKNIEESRDLKNSLNVELYVERWKLVLQYLRAILYNDKVKGAVPMVPPSDVL